MRDGSDAIADWPILNALVNTACGRDAGSRCITGEASASGTRSTPGWSCVADGTERRERRLRRVLTSDPGTGVMRHADAGYPEAIRAARERGVDLPSLD